MGIGAWMVRRAMCPGGGGRWPGVENRKGRLCMYPMIDKEKTGRWLKALFMVKGVRPKDIQAYLSLGCIQTVYRWLDGTNIPSMDHLYALSGLLGITRWSLATRMTGRGGGGEKLVRVWQDI